MKKIKAGFWYNIYLMVFNGEYSPKNTCINMFMMIIASFVSIVLLPYTLIRYFIRYKLLNNGFKHCDKYYGITGYLASFGLTFIPMIIGLVISIIIGINNYIDSFSTIAIFILYWLIGVIIILLIICFIFFIFIIVTKINNNEIKLPKLPNIKLPKSKYCKPINWYDSILIEIKGIDIVSYDVENKKILVKIENNKHQKLINDYITNNTFEIFGRLDKSFDSVICTLDDIIYSIDKSYINNNTLYLEYKILNWNGLGNITHNILQYNGKINTRLTYNYLPHHNTINDLKSSIAPINK